MLSFTVSETEMTRLEHLRPGATVRGLLSSICALAAGSPLLVSCLPVPGAGLLHWGGMLA